MDGRASRKCRLGCHDHFDITFARKPKESDFQLFFDVRVHTLLHKLVLIIFFRGCGYSLFASWKTVGGSTTIIFAEKDPCLVELWFGEVVRTRKFFVITSQALFEPPLIVAHHMSLRSPSSRDQNAFYFSPRCFLEVEILQKYRQGVSWTVNCISTKAHELLSKISCNPSDHLPHIIC
ncbi:hypothetical protein AMTR_s00003p00271720 [Amborella trichopoda]|uniref:Uncharacterized protein n=1 Tax=Amborella trichopoda TaxID=13333 RepID=W1P976_AMBTC|nr:hypothetical protein AMTR_s00003p00271720 [Amborella trichopoda]